MCVEETLPASLQRVTGDTYKWQKLVSQSTADYPDVKAFYARVRLRDPCNKDRPFQAVSVRVGPNWRAYIIDTQKGYREQTKVVNGPCTMETIKKYFARIKREVHIIEFGFFEPDRSENASVRNYMEPMISTKTATCYRSTCAYRERPKRKST